MNYRRFKFEGWLYGLAFLLALSLRLIRLGAMPLNDAEADVALQALQISQGLKPALGSHPAYLMFTAPLFFLYGGGTNFLARLIPALAGSLLVLAPLLFADRIKPRPALLLAFFIAFDPGLTAVSRQVGSPILSTAFTVFALGYGNQNQPRLAGGLAALALLCGPAVWPSLLALGIAWAIHQWVGFHIFSKEAVAISRSWTAGMREAVIPFVVTLVVASTLFLSVPNGLSSALLSIPSYLQGWIEPSGMRIGWMVISLVAYQPFGLMMAVIAMLRGWLRASRRVIPLSIWLLVSMLLSIFYPAREVADLAWTMIPILALASLELARYLDVRVHERSEVLGATLLTIFLGFFGWLNFASLTWISAGVGGYGLRFWLLIGSFVLLAFSLLFVAFGWSIRAAQLGAVWGLGFGLALIGLSGTFGAVGLRGMFNPELWWQRDMPRHAQLLERTVDDLSEWGAGNDDALPVVIHGVDSPALEWALREHRPSIVQVLDVTSSPPLVITNNAGDPALAADYRGQDFTWRLTTSWEIAQPIDWLRWLAFREMIQTGEDIILWARSDLFLGAAYPVLK